MMQCPFHDDKNPSLVITPSKGLWNCFGCDAGGTVIDFVMRSEGISFRHALEILRERDFKVILSSDKKPRHATVPVLKSPLSLDVKDQELLKRTVDYYHERLKEDEKARAYLEKRGLLDDEAILESYEDDD